MATGSGNIACNRVLRVAGMGPGEGAEMSHVTRVKFTIKEGLKYPAIF
jgi:hypothetical protein